MSKMMITSKLLVFLCAICQFGLSKCTERPNIIFILADDLGWDDVSFHGSRQIPTPNLDTLAYDGILLANYYVQPICTPTRGALLTGRHPIHTGLQRGVIFSSQPYGLPLNETILPQYLNKLGYKSHMVGKWHLGFFAEEYTPTSRGFHSHYGYYTGMEDYWEHTNMGPLSWHLGMFAKEYTPTYRGFQSHYGYYQGMEDYWDHTYEALTNVTWGLDFHRNDEVVKTDYGKYSTNLFTDEANEIISQHNTSEPLFLYLPFQAVHSGNGWQPLEAPFEYYQKFSHIQNKRRRMFAAMVSCLDNAVGNIFTTLHKKGMLENSVIVFSTDNGGPPNGFDWNYASNQPLRGTKAGLWEGGVHGDGFVWSPLLQKSGYTSHAMIQVIDWLPTLLSVAGYNMPTLSQNIDGMDMWPVLSEGKPSSQYRTEMLHNIDDSEESWAIRIDDMKLISAKHGFTASWRYWYQTEEIPQGEEAGGQFQKANRNSDDPVIQHGPFANPDEEPAPAHMFESDLRSILQSMGRPAKAGAPYVVNCGPKPPDAAINCNVSVKPCLYNITADPCEYHNLADRMPEAVIKMMERLSEYNKTAVPPGNKPQDPKGFPINNGGLWIPWVTLDEDDLPKGYIRPH